MIILHRPQVTLIGETKINTAEMAFVVKQNTVQCYAKGPWQTDSINDGDLLPEFAGRICYKSFGDKQGRKRNIDYIQNIKIQGHGSVLEHANLTFHCIVPRYCSHEMVRHRAGWAYSQESTRYCKYDPDNAVFIVRDWLNKTEDQKNEIHAQLLSCLEGREFYPNCLAAHIVVTANLRALRHFFEMRGSRHADWAIRLVALDMFSIAREYAPNVFNDFVIQEVDHKDKYWGLEKVKELTNNYRKV